MLVQEGILGQADGLGNGRQRNPPAPTRIADELPGSPVRHVVQDLKYHDSSSFESRFPMADFRVGNDVFSKLDAAAQLGLRFCAVLHAASVALSTLSFKPVPGLEPSANFLPK